ncbi:tight adherence pilus pseudopilin TadF [Vibrio atypicus]|uniref:tight adherence pilus pseudopilin TadF n=1 Tax=Vibrio atypicus TaxID=558271 RepID=UPI001359ACEE|nr:tight adherence pilus pseudopilin TadF [Vibrio atypicus]
MLSRFLRHKQRGSFSVEFAIVGLVFSTLLVFSGDVIIKLSMKGKLDRLSYSMVNILKERTQLYEEDYTIKQSEARELYVISQGSLSRMGGTSFDSNRYRLIVEEQTFRSNGSPNPVRTFNFGPEVCTLRTTLSDLRHLSVVTSWDRQATLYRVSLCYETDNWVGDILGGDFRIVSSDAVIIGR